MFATVDIQTCTQFYIYKNRKIYKIKYKIKYKKP